VAGFQHAAGFALRCDALSAGTQSYTTEKSLNTPAVDQNRNPLRLLDNACHSHLITEKSTGQLNEYSSKSN
jgi:hypothetical protein